MHNRFKSTCLRDIDPKSCKKNVKFAHPAAHMNSGGRDPPRRTGPRPVAARVPPDRDAAMPRCPHLNDGVGAARGGRASGPRGGRGEVIITATVAARGRCTAGAAGRTRQGGGRGGGGRPGSFKIYCFPALPPRDIRMMRGVACRRRPTATDAAISSTTTTTPVRAPPLAGQPCHAAPRHGHALAPRPTRRALKKRYVRS